MMFPKIKYLSISLNLHSQVEFTEWTWSSYWHPVAKGVEFKRDAYREALKDLLPFYNKNFKRA